MNKQLTKIDELISWLEQEAPEDACVVLLAMSDIPKSVDEELKQADRQVEIKTYIEGYDDDLAYMLVAKMIAIPLLRQVFVEALGQVGVTLQIDAFKKWREKNKYDTKYEQIILPEVDQPTLPGTPEPYIQKIQEFCVWMNEKPSRNLTLLTLAQDSLHSVHTTFAMGFAPDLAVLLAKEMKENYGFKVVVESALYSIETLSPFEEFKAWKDELQKKK